MSEQRHAMQATCLQSECVCVYAPACVFVYLCPRARARACVCVHSQVGRVGRMASGAWDETKREGGCRAPDEQHSSTVRYANSCPRMVQYARRRYTCACKHGASTHGRFRVCVCVCMSVCVCSSTRVPMAHNNRWHAFAGSEACCHQSHGICP